MDSYILLITSDSFGRGDENLGRKLMESYFYTLTEGDSLPSNIIFINAGVKLVIGGSDVLDNLRQLEERGVKISACGTCLDYYELKDKVAVGEVGNMYKTRDLLAEANKVITI
ncbi:sulfurtransferase-like selenium metabolism protein YedF [Natranaerofaba carboxydovora]|uniref:sulfurtransferase-like selenium metabolism protein YedF n=1 Tax=Natranaerofaba carboxydovora TaxID=2742683 RepID=UPI001F13A994|nr:sulfurtransferase-like selenium metabolism protein YedF [Natranaerofaba carboxydovora]UMZ74898.1 DsrE/DsrF-like family protein [Natranaerofaba carboxydovora]